jgi:hypothetical protein
LRSTPFDYVVARDTLVPAERLFAHYERIEALCRILQAEDPRLHYLGVRLDRLWDERPVPAYLDRACVDTMVSTPEAAIDLAALRQAVDAALAGAPRIELLFGHTAHDTERKPHGFTVKGRTTAGENWSRDAGFVVNALWDGRLAVDARMGLEPDRAWVYRLKHRVLGRTPPALAGLPSMTMVLGAFGDVVTRPHDDSIYLSWYPACATGWSRDLEPPAAWEAAASGTMDRSEQEPVISNTLAAFDTIIPGLGAVRDAHADGGVIFAWGASDIDDRTSELHRRHEIGITGADGYFSVDTGKLTSAPLFARQLGDLLP